MKIIMADQPIELSANHKARMQMALQQGGDQGDMIKQGLNNEMKQTNGYSDEQITAAWDSMKKELGMN